jgi:16S rRNA (guanine527-N7)-methyltransferase
MNNRKLLISRFLERNTKLNLSAIRDEQGVYDKHIVDALELTQFELIQPWMLVADVGTGGGRPLLALAQSYPDADFIGIDGRRKKMQAVQAIAIESWINNVETQRGRIEEVTWSYDIVTARAVAYADVLLDWIHPILKPGGSMVLYKLDTEEENAIIMMRCNKNRYDITQRHHYQLQNEQKWIPDLDTPWGWKGDDTKRILWILTKHRSHQQTKKQLEK